MKFTKMSGAGNDFIIINNIEERLTESQLRELARDLCRRKISIGADGLMAVNEASHGGDYAMLFINADGTIGEMCGNGARCIARYGHEAGLAGDTQHIETTAGMVIGEMIDKTTYKVRINDPTKIILSDSIEADGKIYECSYIELGDPALPHIVVEMDDFKRINEDSLRNIGRSMRWNKKYPKGANVNFFSMVSGEEDTADIVTFERGVEDFTLACGTGATATALTMVLKGMTKGGHIGLRAPGGRLTVDVEETKGMVSALWLTGPAKKVAVGETADMDWSI